MRTRQMIILISAAAASLVLSGARYRALTRIDECAAPGTIHRAICEHDNLPLMLNGLRATNRRFYSEYFTVTARRENVNATVVVPFSGIREIYVRGGVLFVLD